MDVYTDGEFRRSGFQNDILDAVEGFVPTQDPAVVRIWHGPGGEPQEQGTRQVVAAKLKHVGRMTARQSAFMIANAPGPVKMTVPSPSQFPAISYQAGVTNQFYPTRTDLLWEIASVIKAEIAALVEEGVSYIQIALPGTATTSTQPGGNTLKIWAKTRTRCSTKRWRPTISASRVFSERV